MRIAVTAPTGHVGSRLTAQLLDAGAEVILLARNPNKLKGFIARGAKVMEGDLLDEAFVTRAVSGADALFWLTPPNPIIDDHRAYQRKLAGVAAAAIGKARIPRVVNLSSIGAQAESRSGPIDGLHDVETVLDGTGAHLTHLRAAYYMENLLYSLESIRSSGRIFLPIAGSVTIPWAATRDVGDAAAKVLLDGTWGGRRTRGVLGAADLSFGEAARIVGDVLGRPVEHVTVTPAEAKDAMVGMGMNPRVVETYLEMYDAMESGRLKVAEARTPETTTPTSLAAFARETLLPALRP